jgi:hypothetical protein
MCICCATAFNYAVDEVSTPGYRATYPMQVVGLDQLSICPANTRKGSFSYGDAHALINTKITSGKTIKNNLLAGFRRIHLGLGSKIHQKNSLYGVLGIDSKYSGIEAWLWNGSLVVQPDLQSSSLARKTRYMGTLHGRYEVVPSTHLHVGFYMELGMRASLIRPIIGIDHTHGPWLIQAVFPIKYGISYLAIQNHMFSLMIRPLYTTVRVHEGLRNRPAITQYRGTGGEVRWDYLPTSRWNFWISLGKTISGTLTVGNKNNNHRHHIHLHSAPYINIVINCGI